MAQNKRIQDAIAKQNAAYAEQQEALQGLAADLAYLKDQIPATGGMTEAEVEELAASLEDSANKAQAAADALKQLDNQTDSSNEEPEEPSEPENPEVPEEDEDGDDNEEDEGAGVGAQFTPA